jgi:hypothetical protein
MVEFNLSLCEWIHATSNPHLCRISGSYSGLWRILSVIWRHVVLWALADVTEEPVTFIYRVKEEAKQEFSMAQVGRRFEDRGDVLLHNVCWL